MDVPYRTVAETTITYMKSLRNIQLKLLVSLMYAHLLSSYMLSDFDLIEYSVLHYAVAQTNISYRQSCILCEMHLKFDCDSS